jgi:hypothetical protein
MNFSLKQIRYFVATAQLGQVSRAADQLHVTQSAVTISIRDLEGELGTPPIAAGMSALLTASSAVVEPGGLPTAARVLREWRRSRGRG